MKEKTPEEEFADYTEFFLQQLRNKDNTIYRLKCIVGALCIIIIMLILSNH